MRTSLSASENFPVNLRQSSSLLVLAGGGILAAIFGESLHAEVFAPPTFEDRLSVAFGPEAELEAAVAREEATKEAIADEIDKKGKPAPGTEPATEKPAEETEVEIPRDPPKAVPPRQIRLNLLDGSIITGDLSVAEITVDTQFGKLVVPIEKIRSFTPGLDSYPEKIAEIGALVTALGGDDYKSRESAHKDLAAMGITIQLELERFVGSENAEIKRHITEILKEIEEQSEESDEFDESGEGGPRAWIRMDTVETTDFTVTGKVSPSNFVVESKYGPLKVQLADVKRGERDSGTKASFRRNLAVPGENLAQRSFKSTGIRVQAGDRISIKADGTIVMTPWGSNSVSTPDGGMNFGWYIPSQIPGGCLVAKIGDKGTVFKVGRQLNFVAKSSGLLQLAIGMQGDYAGEGYTFPGEYRVKLKVDPK